MNVILSDQDTEQVVFHDGLFIYEPLPIFSSDELYNFPIGIDWISFSFQSEYSLQSIINYINEILSEFNLELFSEKSPSPIKFFDQTYHIYIKGCFTASHGHLSVRTTMSDSPTYILVLTGAALFLMGNSGSLVYRNFFDVEDYAFFNHKIHRIDLCLDDIYNEFKFFERIESDYADGYFTRGRTPSFRSIINNDLSGNTIYIGKRPSHKMIRIYNKGQQLGDPFSSWVRFEIEVRPDSSHILPFEMLLNPEDYFYGFYPKYFEYLFQQVKFLSVPRVENSKSLLASSFEIVKNYYLELLKKQYGHYLYAFRYIYQQENKTDTDLLNDLVRSFAKTVNGFPPSFQAYFNLKDK